jgi:hypothetical protein
MQGYGGNFHPFEFTPKSHLRRIILCQGYSTFFFQTYFRITLLLLRYLFSFLVKFSQNNDLTDFGSRSTEVCSRVQPKIWVGDDNREKGKLRVV